MIIEKVIISTFGGLSKKEIALEEGMNVIVGPNESGKSTIYNAIQHTLFTPAHLTPARFKKQMGRFIPVGGGDTIEVTVHFRRQGKKYALQRRWGASVSSSLTLPDGAVMTDDDAIQNVIRESLQVPEGTCKTIMMSYQSGLSVTVADIQQDNETLESLGDLLRKAVMEMDGVSVEAFRARIEESYRSYFGRWDIEANYPEDNRGIENPWLMGVGSITRLFYEKERVRKDLDEAVRYENELDELNGRISGHAEDLADAGSYVRDNKAIKEDAVKGRLIEAELKGFQLEYERLEKINREWPVTESKVNDRTKRISELEANEKGLSKEKEEAADYQKARQLLDKFSRVEKKKQAVDETEKGLQIAGKLTGGNLKGIRGAFQAKSILEASLSAGKFFVRFTAHTDTELEIKKGLEDKYVGKTKAGETLEFQADGRLLLAHPDWVLDVTSGEGDYSQILADYEKARSDMENLLQKFSVKDLEEAEAVNAAYEVKLADLKNARSNFKEELGEYAYDDLKEKVKGIQVKKPAREIETILKTLAESQAEIKSLKRERDELQEKLSGYAEEYGDQPRLLGRLTEVAAGRKEKQKAFGTLNPLPAEIANLEEFITKYENMESRLRELADEDNKLIQDRIRLEGKSPERSVEEIENELAQADEKFKAELRKGMAIKRIKETVEGLLLEMDTKTYKALETEVSELMQEMTGGRYKDVALEKSTPSGICRRDGVVIPYEILSEGTKDVLGIALRLAITRSFLQGKEGFVIMDDPLVDLDPDRQSKAANALQNFAGEKQIILLTCHPTHAEKLGGHRILLE